ncbi:Glycosidase [Duganella sp. CF402]|uniref:alpha-amylase family glycosyl hydrolase n=1 Tax=unclassified Duganella TaxID=2636909 RepID=UPI0008D51A71|nr:MULTISPECIES: alpha-amylase family glycosyl hydrolase [unclassified Duganella]RZT05419.1 maltogenic amylase [Duganella sp. BK701]SEN04894.1 Glycosidase [Duganella sp. CF402]
MKTLLMALALSGAVHAAAPDAYQPKPYVQFQHAEWSKNASIYQINTRQFTPEGTFAAAERELPRLKALGVDILWLMPIHPIGAVKRKGTLGSPYAVRDHLAVNPEFGTLAQFKHFVAAAHAQGQHVILDWVGNHTAWDHVLRTSHPEWYEKDRKGQPHPTPWYDWDDIIDLDYQQPGLRRYMTDAMRFWVREAGVDGYRVDAAGLTPLDFWEQAAAELRAIKPVFLLAEWESRDMHARAFDASYAWTWWEGLRAVAEGKADATSLYTYYAWNQKFYPKQAYRMLYTTNHDKNAWDGTEFEIFGPAVDAAIAFSFVSEGIALIYNGQEVGNRKRLAFFERDALQWQASPYTALYTKLLAMKKQHSALWNGEWGATMEQVPNDAPKQVFSFVRQNASDKVFAVFNLSAQPVHAGFRDDLHLGRYRDFATGAVLQVDGGTRFDLAPWSYKILTKAE